MSEVPVLLVALAPQPDTTRRISESLPGIEWAYGAGSAASSWGAVRAMLVGSLERELPQFDVRLVPRLELVQTLYTGVDAFPFDRFPPGITVCANVGGYAPFVAEHALALTLALARSIPEGMDQVRAGRLRPAPPARTLVRKNALLLGFGAIARELLPRLRALGMTVEGLSRTGAPDPAVARMFASDGLHEALSRADVVIDARPLTLETRRTIDAAALAAMRPEAIFVNVGRAETVDEAALFEQLKSRPRFRVGLDVFWDEGFGDGRLGLAHPFPELPNFLGSPHCAAFVPEARGFAIDRAVENLRRFFGGDPPRHVVDRGRYVTPR